MKTSLKKVIIAGVIILTAAYCIMAVTMGNAAQNVNNTNQVESDSLSKIKKTVPYEFDIPEFLLSEDDVKYSSFNNSIVTMQNSYFTFKVADVQGLNIRLAEPDIEPDVRKTYTYDTDSEIKNVSYSIYDSDILVNWYTDELSYGLYLVNYDAENGLSVLLDAIGINSEYLVESEDDTSESEETREFTFDELGISIEIPWTDLSIITSTESIKSGYSNDRAIFIIGNKVGLVIEQTATMEDSNNEAFICVEMGGYTLEYLSNNPYEKDSIEYNYYNEIIDNIDDIVTSFHILG